MCVLCVCGIINLSATTIMKRNGFHDGRVRGNQFKRPPLVPIEKIQLSPLHIKLGILKSFIKVLNPNGRAFNELPRIFPRLSSMKIKDGMSSNLFELER